MELLPETAGEFREAKYWNHFYRKRNARTFEWYGNLDDFAGLLAPKLKILAASRSGPGEAANIRKLEALNLGNGNSRLPLELHKRFGISKITNVDFSASANSEMQKATAHIPTIKWDTLDVRQLASSYAPGSFDLVLDKAFLDAFLAHDDGTNSAPEISRASARDDMLEYLQQILKVLRPGGVWVIVSLLQPYITEAFVHAIVATTFSNEYEIKVDQDISICPFRVKSLTNSKLQPYLVTLRVTKASKAMPLLPKCCFEGPLSSAAVAGTTFPLVQLPKKLKEEFIKRRLDIELADFHPGESRSLALQSVTVSQNGGGGSPSQDLPVKYRLEVWDNIEGRKAKYIQHGTVAMVVPTGHKKDWLYSTPAGFQEVAKQAKCQRLVLVHIAEGNDLGMDSTEPGSVLKHIIPEVSPYLQKLSLNSSEEIPVVAVPEHWSRRIRRCVESSPFAGTIYVYDYQDASNDFFNRRTMTFEVNPRLEQSEVALNAEGRVQFTNPIYCDYYSSMIASFALMDLHTRTSLDCAVLGVGEFHDSLAVTGLPAEQLNDIAIQKNYHALLDLTGGGVLVGLLRTVIAPMVQEMRVMAVEIDKPVLKVARDYFEYPADDVWTCDNFTLTTLITDALDFLADGIDRDLDVVIMDVNDHSAESELTCPPAAFIETSTIGHVRRRLREDGFFICNLVTRSTEARRNVLTSLKKFFPSISEFPGDSDVNRIIICNGPEKSTLKQMKGALERNLRMLTDSKQAISWVPGVHNDAWLTRLKLAT